MKVKSLLPRRACPSCLRERIPLNQCPHHPEQLSEHEQQRRAALRKLRTAEKHGQQRLFMKCDHPRPWNVFECEICSELFELNLPAEIKDAVRDNPSDWSFFCPQCGMGKAITGVF